MTTLDASADRTVAFSRARVLVRRIVDSVAEGQKCHLKVVFADGSVHHTTPIGEPDITIVFRRRAAEWRTNNDDRAQARRNAEFHYGLPMAFFHLVLGDTYSYSEGLWSDDKCSLDQAQHDNFNLICRKLRL